MQHNIVKNKQALMDIKNATASCQILHLSAAECELPHITIIQTEKEKKKSIKSMCVGKS